MSKWLARALEALSQNRSDTDACANRANCAKTPSSEVSTVGFGTNGTQSGISDEEIRRRLAWTAQRLREEHGRAPEQARNDALTIVRADLLNDERLAPSQPDPRLCLVCGSPGTTTRVLVPVLTARKDNVVWLHSEPCHGERLLYRRRQIDDLVRNAVSIPSDSAMRLGMNFTTRPDEDVTRGEV